MMKRLILFLLLLIMLCFPLLASEEGLASWYGGKFNGRKTASGEIFDTNKFTAAHKTLPFGTVVKVINLENNKSTIIRINDRGPFIKGRIIDLSRAAAAEIGMLGTGVARVRIEIIKSEPRENYYTIQVGAYGKKANADRIKEKIETQGLKIEYEYAANGIIRVVIRHVSSGSLERVKTLLNDLGFKSLLIKKE